MKKLGVLSLCMICGCMFLGGCSGPRKEHSYRQISMNEAKTLMESESGYILLDVRTAAEYADGHIPGAVNLPNESIGEAEIPALPDKEQMILVYCRSGNRSKQAAAKLAALGYSNIVEIGGIMDWTGAVEKQSSFRD